MTGHNRDERGKLERKIKWVKPKLIVLLRGKPEEAVILACKTGSGSPGSVWIGCQSTSPAWCTQCEPFMGT